MQSSLVPCTYQRQPVLFACMLMLPCMAAAMEMANCMLHGDLPFGL